MNFKKYITLSMVAVMLVVTACEEAIEIQPEAAVTPEIALKRVGGINALVLSAYRRVHDFTYYGQQQILNAEALADNLVIANNTGRYTGQVVNTVNSHFGTWNSTPWQIINDANIILAHADAAAPTLAISGTFAGFPESEAQTAPKRLRYKGEAYFLRALAYHDLVKVYGYEPGREVNGFNLGVILRTTPTEKVSDADKRARATNEEIYAQIESDLLAAIQLLPAEVDFVGSTTDFTKQWAPGERTYRASKAAAKALLARVYLFWGKYAQANTLATEVLTPADPGGTSKTLTTAANHVASWSATQHPESIFEAEIRTADWSSVDGVNNSLSSVTSTAGGASAQFAVGASDELIAAFEANDVRRSLYITNGANMEPRKWMGEKGGFLENIPIIRVAEVVLIAAEARARNNDDAGAQTMINMLRTNRGLPATTETDQALIDLIMNERRVELAFEGHRFFDLKRNGMDIIKPVELLTNNVPYTDFRILANIPNAETTFNAQLQQNPNY